MFVSLMVFVGGGASRFSFPFLPYIFSSLSLFKIDQAGFTLATTGGKNGASSAAASARSSSKHTMLGERATENMLSVGRDNERPSSSKIGDPRYSSGEEMFKSGGKDVFGVPYSRTPSNLGEESPTLADLSSNNTPETPHRTKHKKAVRKTSKDHHYRNAKGRGRTPTSASSVHSSGRDDVDQSVFPIRTPDKEGFLGPLTDLLEEEITLPGESRHNSAEKGGKNWAYLPQHRKSPTTSTSSSASSGASSSSACSAVAALGAASTTSEGIPVSYTHLTLPTTPYV